MEDSILDKVSALLAKAEASEFPEEADAFVSKAQSLATVHAIDLAVARQHRAKKLRREEPMVKRVYIGKGGTKGLHYFADLLMQIGFPNDLRFTIAHNSTFINLFGFPSDIEVVEAMYASLSAQMVAAANEAIKRGDHKLPENRYLSDTTGQWRSDARVFKGSFYEGFTHAVSRRLWAARNDAVQGQEVKSSLNGELVLKRKSDEVKEFYNERNTAKGSWKGGSNQYTSIGGEIAGNIAGRKAKLTEPKGIAGSKGSIAASKKS